MKSLAKFALVLTFSLGFGGCGGDKKTEETSGRKTGEKNSKNTNGSVTIDQSSPEKVVKSFRQALRAKDWKSAFACVTSQSHDTLTFGTMMTAGQTTAGDKTKEKSLSRLLGKHGIGKKTMKSQGNPLAVVKDKAALFSDLMDWLKKNTETGDGKVPPIGTQQFVLMKFSNFKTDGEKATAKVSMNGEKKEKLAEFKKLDGKWFLDMVGSN